MNCIRCRKPIAEDAVFCCFCGKRQPGIAVQTAPKRKKRARRANGTGNVTLLPGRSKPYRARVAGQLVGYYATQLEAEEAIVAARRAGPKRQFSNYTMQQVFDAVMADRGLQGRTIKYQRDLLSSWNYMEDLHDRRAAECYTDDFQAIIYAAQDEGKSLSHQQKLRVLVKKLCLWCRQHGLHAVDYSEGLTVCGSVKRERVAFDDAALRALYAHRAERDAGLIWFLCMTGCRYADLAKIRCDERIDLQGKGIWLEGSKTAAGRNRYIKIDPITWSDVFLRFYNAAVDGEAIFTNASGAPFSLSAFRREFFSCLDRLGIQKTPEPGELAKYIPYTCRHTFATLSDRAGVDREVLQRALGHKIGSDVTDRHYIDRTVQVEAAAREFDKLAGAVAALAE